jgi:hypothetical protein
MRKDTSSSYSGKKFARHSGRILPEEPFDLKSSWYDQLTGVHASLFFHYRNVPAPFPKRFSAHFDAAVDPKSAMKALAEIDPNYLNYEPAVKCKIVYEKLRGIDCVKMAYIRIGSSSREDWWLDPKLGYALLRYVNIRANRDGSEQVMSSIDVTRLKEVAKGIWWPMEACFVQSPREAGKPWKRIVYQASHVVANDPDFNEGIFTIHFPKGYTIDDRVTGKRYKVGEDTNTLKEQLKK